MSNWDKATNILIDTLNLKECKTQKEVKAKIIEYFKGKYKSEPLAKLKMLAADFTESVCLKLNIAQK